MSQSSSAHPRPIALIGLSGAGKSTVAPRLAERAQGMVIDLDARIESIAGVSVGELFARESEAGFRRLEVEALVAAIAHGAAVIACGGGIVESAEARALLLRECRVVWLEVMADTAAKRVSAHAHTTRPLLAGGATKERLAELLARRAAWYTEIAWVRVATDDLDPDQVADRVLAAVAVAGGEA